MKLDCSKRGPIVFPLAFDYYPQVIDALEDAAVTLRPQIPVFDTMLAKLIHSLSYLVR